MSTVPPIVSKPYTARVGANQTTLFFYTSTKIKQDSQGRVSGGETTLFYSPKPGNYIPSAKTNDGGKTWEYLKDSDGNFILGDDARKSLQEGVLKNTTNTFIKDTAEKSGVPPQQVKNLQLTENTESTNIPSTTATTEEGTPTFDAAAGTEELRNLSRNQQISRSTTRNRNVKNYPSKELLKYPITLDLREQDCIQFTMIEYSPRTYDLATIGRTGTVGERGSRNAGSTVTLPIQPAITDTNTVDWANDTMDAATIIAATAAYQTILNGAEGAIDAMGAITQLIGGEGSDDIKKAFATGFAGNAAGTKGLLTRVTGGIVNPNMELLFNGPQLRSFTFNFSLSAREPKESIVIRNIIRFFKQGMSVKRSNTDLFLSTPHIFQIKYLHKNTPHAWINTIKDCALLNCSVNYTPAQNYATFPDGAMTSYELSLQFTELEPIYDDDYEELGPDVIGY